MIVTYDVYRYVRPESFVAGQMWAGHYAPQRCMAEESTLADNMDRLLGSGFTEWRTIDLEENMMSVFFNEDYGVIIIDTHIQVPY